MPLTRPLPAWLTSSCSASLCRADQALESFQIGIQRGLDSPTPAAVVQGQDGWDRAVGPTDLLEHSRDLHP